MNDAPVAYLVGPADAGHSLLELALRLLGAAEGRRVVERGGAWLEGQRIEDGSLVVPIGATLLLRRPPGGIYSEVTLDHEDIAYEDEWLLALHKRAGWYVGATPWDTQGNVRAAATRFLAARDGATAPLHLAHQLDRATSGLLLLSKHPTANAPLQAAFANQRVTKTYLALCAGQPPEAGAIQTGHGRSAGGRWRLYPREEVGAALPGGGGRVKLAHTSYRVLQRLADAALVQASPHTGRTHQIRLHLAHLGHPLLGDARYGGPASYAGITLPGHLLHAARLALAHPLTGQELELESPTPPLFAQVIAR